MTASNSEILIDKIKEIYNEGWIKTLRRGDTGVGFTFETKLGIEANSKKKPDFMGIEIKAFRKRSSGSLVTLFSQVPNWKNSNTDRNKILDEYGYSDVNERFNLYCSVYANITNKLNWQLRVDREEKKIKILNSGKEVTFWDFKKIEERILNKHNETFFVYADTKKENDSEYFLYNKILFTKKASLENFLKLIENSKICHDFVMHRKKNGSTRDHGFLWRIKNTYIPDLFEQQEIIDLTK